MTHRLQSECGWKRRRLCQWPPRSIFPNRLCQGWWKSVWSCESNKTNIQYQYQIGTISKAKLKRYTSKYYIRCVLLKASTLNLQPCNRCKNDTETVSNLLCGCEISKRFYKDIKSLFFRLPIAFVLLNSEMLLVTMRTREMLRLKISNLIIPYNKFVIHKQKLSKSLLKLVTL